MTTKQMFLGHLITGLPGVWIQDVRNGCTRGFLGQPLLREIDAAVGLDQIRSVAIAASSHASQPPSSKPLPA